MFLLEILLEKYDYIFVRIPFWAMANLKVQSHTELYDF